MIVTSVMIVIARSEWSNGWNLGERREGKGRVKRGWRE